MLDQLALALADGVVDAAGEGGGDGVGLALIGEGGVEGDEGDRRGRAHAGHAVAQEGDQQLERAGVGGVAEQRGGGAAGDGVVDPREQEVDGERGADRSQGVEGEQLQHVGAVGEGGLEGGLGRGPADRPEGGGRGGADVVVGGGLEDDGEQRDVLGLADVGQQIDVHAGPAAAGLQALEGAGEAGGAEVHEHLVAGRAGRDGLGGEAVEEALEQGLQDLGGRRDALEGGLEVLDGLLALAPALAGEAGEQALELGRERVTQVHAPPRSPAGRRSSPAGSAAGRRSSSSAAAIGSPVRTPRSVAPRRCSRACSSSGARAS